MSWFKKIFASFSIKERGVFYASFLACAISGVLLVWILFVSVTVEVPARGGEYTEGIIGQPSYVNPVLAENDADKDLVRLTFANLSALADKIELDKNRKTYHVRLKENLFWSDGEKLTSDDVVFTLQRLQDPQTASPYFSNWQGVSVSRVSELEVQFDLAGSYAFFRQNLDGFYPIPKHLFADTPPANWKLSDYNLKPVGSGPYVFDSYEKRADGFISAYHLKPNGRYSGSQPYVENLDLAFFTKADDLIKSFNAGQVDGVARLDPGTVPAIRRTYDLTRYSLPDYYAVFWNQNQNPALADDTVRNALSLAVDRGDLVQKVLGGYGKPVYGPLPADLPGAESLSGSFDSNLASQILSTAGWKMGDRGMLEKSEGKSNVQLQFSIVVPDVPFLVNTANYLKDHWTAIGASVSLNILPLQNVLDGPIKNRDYQAILFGNRLNGQDLYPFWDSSEKYYPQQNLALYGDKNTDKLLESIRQNLDDSSRAASLQNAAVLIASAHPAAFLYSPYSLFASSKDVSGISGGFLGDLSDRLLPAPSWYVKVARNFK